MGLNSRHIVLEGSRDNALGMFLPYFQERGINVSLSTLKQYLLNKFVNEASMNNLSLRSNYYLVGVARYYFNGDLTANKELNAFNENVKDDFKQDVCARLNVLIDILRNAYIDSVGTKFEQPEDFGTLTIQKLLRKYGKKIDAALGINVKEKKKEEKQVSDDYTAGPNYTYEILYSFDDATKYYRYTQPGAWCITYGKTHYNAYVNRLKIHYVIFKMNGFENVPRKRGDGFTFKKPHDLYGNSLIAVLQSNSSPEPIYITSRWNHGSSVDGTSGTEADHAYTKEEFLNVIGQDESVLVRAFEQWKANLPKKETVNRKELNAEKLAAVRGFKYLQMRINNGASLKEIHDNEGLKIIPLDERSLNDVKKIMGTYLMTMPINGKTYTTLMDRKVLMPEKLLFNEDGYSRHIKNKSDRFSVIQECHGKPFYIYDKLRHKFVEVDGIYKFKYLSSNLDSYYNIDTKYAMVAMSNNQKALIDLDTFEPIRATNGAVWFENITINDNYYYTGAIPYIGSKWNDTIIEMTYDSSANEVYLFNSGTKSFIKTRTEDGFVYYGEKRHLVPDGFIPMEKRVDGVVTYKVFDYNKNEFLVLDKYDEFGDIKGVEFVFAFSLPNDKEKVYYYDKEAEKYITYRNKIVSTRWIKLMNTSRNKNTVLISLSTGDYPYKDVLIYNLLTHDLLRDDISGDLYNIYGFGQDETFVAYVPNSNEKYVTKSPKKDYEEKQQMAGMKESFVRSFKSLLERMGEKS